MIGQISASNQLRTSSEHVRLLGVSQTLRRWAEGATYVRQGGHHDGHRPTF